MTSSMQKQVDASHGGGCRDSLVSGHCKRQGAAEWNGLGRKQSKAKQGLNQTLLQKTQEHPNCFWNIVFSEISQFPNTFCCKLCVPRNLLMLNSEMLKC